ncbi:MAG: hypothetical protein AB7E32_02340 [Desulfovibrio sp.]
MPTPEQHMDMCALSALATTFSQYDSPLLWSGLGSLSRHAANRRPGETEVRLERKIRFDNPIPMQIQNMPGNTFFTLSRSEDERLEATFLDQVARSVRRWPFSFRPFFVFVDEFRNLLWAVDGKARLLRCFEPGGQEVARMEVPAATGGCGEFHPRYACCRENDILLGYSNGSHGVVSLGMADQGREPRFLLNGLPHMERLFWANGLLLSLHFNPNALMVHTLTHSWQPPLRTVLLDSEPLSLARVDNGFLISTKNGLVRLGSDLDVRWQSDLGELTGEDLSCPCVTEAGGSNAWLKGKNSNVIYNISV